jgi:hypothetical protein
MSIGFLQAEAFVAGSCMQNAVSVGGIIVATISAALCPPVTTGVVIFKAIVFGAATVGGYCVYKKKRKNKNFKNNSDEAVVFSCGGGRDPKDDEDFVKKHPHGIYKDASYHHSNSLGNKSPCPQDGQDALDYSFPVNDVSLARVGVSNNQIVILKKTSDKLYHGYIVTWEMLEAGGAKTQLIRNALIKNNLVSKSGKIINQLIKKI